jgi:hypothetical protein
MKRLVVALVVVAVVAGVALWRFAEAPLPYAELRQASVQAIPGTLGYALEPPPDELNPGLPPREIRRRYPAGDGEVQISLASLRDRYDGRLLASGWILVARGVCLRNQKGELVSDARGGDPADLDCTDATLWLLAADASSGEALAALVGHDDTLDWSLDVGV